MRVSICAAAVALAVASGAWIGATRASEARPTTRPYPLDTCVVSGQRLGEMGDPNVIHYHGREVRLCCKDCEKDFNKAPQKYLKKLDGATTKPSSTQPSEQQPNDGHQQHSGHDHGHMH